jgi:hypothetical protein
LFGGQSAGKHRRLNAALVRFAIQDTTPSCKRSPSHMGNERKTVVAFTEQCEGEAVRAAPRDLTQSGEADG